MINANNVQKFESIIDLLDSITLDDKISLSQLRTMINVRKAFVPDSFIEKSLMSFYGSNNLIDYVIPIYEVINIIQDQIIEFKEAVPETKSKNVKSKEMPDPVSGIPDISLLKEHTHEEILESITDIFGDQLTIESDPLKISHYLPLFQKRMGIENRLKDFTEFLIASGLFLKVGNQYRYYCDTALDYVSELVNTHDEMFYRVYEPSVDATEDIDPDLV